MKKVALLLLLVCTALGMHAFVCTWHQMNSSPSLCIVFSFRRGNEWKSSVSISIAVTSYHRLCTDFARAFFCQLFVSLYILRSHLLTHACTFTGGFSLSFSLFSFHISPFIHFPSTIFFLLIILRISQIFFFYPQCYLSSINSKTISHHCSNYCFSYIYLLI